MAGDDGWAGVEVAAAALQLLGPAGDVFRFLLDQTPVVRRRQGFSVIEALVAAADCDAEGVMERMRDSPPFLHLIAEASEAAARTVAEEKLEALRRVVRLGLNDDAAIDTSLFLVRTLGEMEGLHIRMLAEIDGWSRLVHADGVEAATVFMRLGLFEEKEIGHAIVADLIRLGLVEGNVKLSNGNYGWHTTRYATRVLEFLR